VLRLVEQHGRAARVSVSSDVGEVRLLSKRNLLEENRPSSDTDPGQLHGYEVSTVAMRFDTVSMAGGRRSGGVVGQPAPEAEAAQPLYARYWLHNRGPAPLGGLPAVAHLHPHRMPASGEVETLRLTVAGDCTDAVLSGRVELLCPPGWSATPEELAFELEPGGYREADLSVRIPPDVRPGCYPLRAQLTLTGADLPPSWRQTVEDVCLIDVGEPAGQLLRLIDGPADIVLDPGQRAPLAVTVGADAGADLAVEAHLISPWGTWEWLGPAAVGAVLPARGQVRLTFEAAPPPWTGPGQWWALVRVAAAGHLLYTPAVRVIVR
jgi:alpha-mannosidase